MKDNILALLANEASFMFDGVTVLINSNDVMDKVKLFLIFRNFCHTPK
jgi:hypothetical protein